MAAADGVVHAELRYAPELHRGGGLGDDDVIEAVSDGISEGIARAAEAGQTIQVVQILVIMRQADHGKEIAELALRWRRAGVGAVDLAGPEAGFSPVRHQYALRRLRQAAMPVTIHAGEGDGVSSIADAVLLAGAVRIGHGARIVEDIEFGPLSPEDPWGLAEARLGDLAQWVRDQQVPLELCPTSNLDTHLVASRGLHPITALHRLGFAATVSTDNRLMSATTLTDELMGLITEASWTFDDVRDVTVTAAWSAFIHHDEREKLVEETILPAFAPSPQLSPNPKGRHRA